MMRNHWFLRLIVLSAIVCSDVMAQPNVPERRTPPKTTTKPSSTPAKPKEPVQKPNNAPSSSTPAKEPAPQTPPPPAAEPVTTAPEDAAKAREPVRIPTLRTDEPYSVPNLGLSVYLPEDSLVDLSRIEGARTRLIITSQGERRDFIFQINSSISTEKEIELSTALENIVAQRRKFHTAKDARGRTISILREFDRDESLIIGQHPAQRVYLDVPPDPSQPVTGYTIFQTGPGQFVIFQMDCPVNVFPQVRELYELMVASVQFRDPAELGADRAAAILAGQGVLSGLSADDYLSVLDDQPQFYRVYRPAPTGSANDDEEIGYQRIEFRKGNAGDLDPSKPRSKWTSADEQPGIIVRVDARALSEGTVVDSVSLFFLSTSRENELWSVTMLVRRGQVSEQWVETGIRRGERLTVKTTHSGGDPTSADWSPLPQGYLSRVESYLLPRLAVNARIPGLLGFYVYESNLGKLTLRREELTQDATGVWTLISTPSENSLPTRTQLDARGRILRRVLPDGQAMEPIEQPRLKRIWQDKKLPID